MNYCKYKVSSQCVWCVDEIQCYGWGGYSLLSEVQQSDGLRDEAVSCSAGSDAAVPSA